MTVCYVCATIDNVRAVDVCLMIYVKQYAQFLSTATGS